MRLGAEIFGFIAMNTDNNSIDKIDGDVDYLALPAVCDLSAASKVHVMVTDKLTDGDLHLNAGEVERCGTVIAQILIAASAELKQQGNLLQINSMSEEFKVAFKDLGLESHLSEWGSS
ncbi:STAS domain-containing protein [Roseibium sp.]|uniref:STAS domain-containing protein n=1 Tax=Roseibium sp. TaxID=1936156 RepID=UPI003A97461F